MSEEKNIIEINKILEDKTKFENLGSKIIKSAIKNVAEEKLGIKPKNPMVEIEIRKGEVVPQSLKDKIDTDINGRSNGDWTDSWTDLIIWKNNWREIGSPDTDTLDTDHRLKEISKDVFNDKEIKILKDLNILDNIKKDI